MPSFAIPFSQVITIFFMLNIRLKMKTAADLQKSAAVRFAILYTGRLLFKVVNPGSAAADSEISHKPGGLSLAGNNDVHLPGLERRYQFFRICFK